MDPDKVLTTLILLDYLAGIVQLLARNVSGQTVTEADVDAAFKRAVVATSNWQDATGLGGEDEADD